MPQGSLQFTIRYAEEAFPVPSATIFLTANDGTDLGQTTVTGENGGVSREFFIDAPPRALSLSPGEAVPYSTVNARIIAEGFSPVVIRGIQIFDGEKSLLPVELLPGAASASPNGQDNVLEYNIPPHALRQTRLRTPEGPEEGRLLGEVFIPLKITVHLGAPNSDAANVTVPFIDYIKNVASSEIYPTWPENSLRANILCQISFALNRIFTEWYPSRGYNFNITSSTAYDQYFVYGRNIFESVSTLVDELFNEYIRRPGRIEPFFAEYCNGSTVSCAGLSQWGTVTLAYDGRTPLEILRFYYGNVEIVETNNIRAIEGSYPGSPLRVGSSGPAVRTIQQQLNRIRVNYPFLPPITRVDGIFGEETRKAVEAFQTVFDLTRDGVVGKKTWYRISYIYVAIKRLGELNSEGELPQYNDESYPGLLRLGDRGSGVRSLQFYLSTLAAFNPFLRDVSIDGVFGNGTQEAVLAFQRYYGLTPDGLVGEGTWNRLVQIYRDLTEGGSLTIRPYPGRVLRLGSEGDNVLYIQQLINRIRPVFATLPSLEEDGVFGSRVRSAVRELQRLFGLDDDGIVGEDTWNVLNRVFGSVRSGCLDNGRTVTGRVLQFGSAGSDVSELQRKLNTIGTALSPIPTLATDGAYGRRTEEAVTVFQRIFGLTPDGEVGNATRTRINAIDNAVLSGCLPRGGIVLREGDFPEEDFFPEPTPFSQLDAAPFPNDEAPTFPDYEAPTFPNRDNTPFSVPDVAPPSSHTDIPLWKREFLGDYPQE